MLFNSLEYFIFLPVVFFLYWTVFKKHLKAQNALILLASYIFYGMWDWRFLSLILLSTVVDYITGLNIYASQDLKTRKLWLWASIIFNIGLLGFFKYYNFFLDSWIDLLSVFGYHLKSTWTLKVILPVGISFYTFQTMSYSFDVYYRKIKPTKDFLSFATYVSFFPQLVAGPIERASNLLPQIAKKRNFKYNQIVEGLKLILWGLFKKVAVADAIGPIVDDMFANYSSYPASTLILGIVMFSFQIYCDFSGYSDIAIGSAKLFGIELMSNFKFPYFSRNIGEFWQRWHISLSTWFKSYLYIPLGGSRVATSKVIRNVFIIFIISGFWHGANWTFIFWGGLHAVAFIPVLLLKRNRAYKDSTIGSDTFFTTLKEITAALVTFSVVSFSWIFFRSNSLRDSFQFINRIFEQFYFEPYFHVKGYRMIDYYILIIVFILYEFRIRKDERNPIPFKSKYVRFITYTILIFMMLLFYDDNTDKSFIYFQF
ncbi:MBOAT family protein [Mangrovimonas sp. DI 80]|uniref:MBOAT family O-acyltransferase n=1 Tax=Mangrovimonas sp. DI 80 TaxID=1779330 RepID=UPI0009786BFA|nr:MBOAT family O-acyltransferase [Mangrovimonas sp. DI 80]OMP30682.1 membrane-bound O-acyltransferase family protein [Mangrovimonas sp. DI 80]